MQEQMNRAMASLSASVGQDVPTLDEVRAKIETRYARALGATEVQSGTVQSRMLEVEQAQMNSEARARLGQIRAQLGLEAGDSAEAAPTPPTASASTEAPPRANE